MSDNTTVSNSPTSSNSDIPVKTTDEGGYHIQHVNVDSLASGFSLPEFDYVAVTYPSATQEVYEFKVGGSGGSTVATITVNYTDSTKDFVLNVAKT